MLDIDAIDIKRLPFEGLEILQEIVEFEGIAILSHYIDANKVDVLSYLVDYDERGYRRLITKATKQELFKYLVGSKSLKSLFSEIESDYIFLVDYDTEDNITQVRLLSKYVIEEKYLPVENSFKRKELNEFYLEYFKKDYYDYRIRQNSFIVKVESPNKTHGETVGAREGAIVLNHTCNSIEGYIRVKSYRVLKNNFGNVRKINQRINKTADYLSPRISHAADGSFEIWLAIDTLTFNGQNDRFDGEIKDGLIEGYKQDVLDVDYSSEEDAKIIAEKYTEDEIKLIFDPIRKLVESDNFVISVSDPKNSIEKKTLSKSTEKFWQKILPPPTIEELQNEEAKKHRIITVVLNLEEGQNITKLTKRALKDSLIFAQESGESVYNVNNPIVVDGAEITLKKPIKCTFLIDDNNHISLFNEKLEIQADGEPEQFNEIVENIKRQFFAIVQDLKNIEEKNHSKAEEIRQYLK